MDPAIAATLIGVLGARRLLGVFAGAFHLLRSDLKELRTESRGDLQEFRVENRARPAGASHREPGPTIVRPIRGSIRLEGKLDMLILALARAGFLIDPQAPPPPDPEG